MAEAAVKRQANVDQILLDAGCRAEQLVAALEVISGGIHEIFDGLHGEVPELITRQVYTHWLVLQAVRRDLAALGERIGDAEQANMDRREA